jgi:hypothetical protein
VTTNAAGTPTLLAAWSRIAEQAIEAGKISLRFPTAPHATRELMLRAAWTFALVLI